MENIHLKWYDVCWAKMKEFGLHEYIEAHDRCCGAPVGRFRLCRYLC